MSLYAGYIKELQDRETIESDSWFINFKIFKDECFITEAYIVPEKRGMKLTKELVSKVEAVAKSRNCKYVSCTVIPSNNNATRSLSVALMCGFKLVKSEPDKIWFLKEVV